MNQVQRYNQTIPFAPNAAVLSAENAVWLLLEDAAMVSGHEQCHGFLYHTETREIICLTHLLAGRLTALDRGARLRVVGFNAQNQRCILTVRDPDSTQAVMRTSSTGRQTSLSRCRKWLRKPPCKRI